MDKTCKNCSQVYSVKPSRAAKSSYCSVKCMGEGYKSQMRGENNPNYRGVNVEKICPVCNQSFTARPELRCCSIPCAHEFARKPDSIRSKLRARKSLPDYKPPVRRGPYLCKVCGVDTKIRRRKVCDSCRAQNLHLKQYDKTCSNCDGPFVTIDARAKYCSMRCSKSLEANPNYKGGITPKNKKIRASDDYKAWRQEVFKRDNFTCLDCGQVGHALHAHHIKPFSTHVALRFEVANGATLCKSCHSLHHANMNFKYDRTVNTKEHT